MLLGASCSRHPDFNTTERGVKWRLLAFTEASQSLDSAEQYYVEYLMLPQSSNDTLAYEYDRQVEKGDDAMQNLLQTRSVGDSLEILSSLPDIFNSKIAYWDTVRYFIRIDRMRTKAQLESRRQKELVLLDSLVRLDTIVNHYQELDGIYLQVNPSGDTTQVLNGKEIVIHYKGRTLSGEVFDDSRRMVAPLRFVFGNEGQVLLGIEKALGVMRKGDYARVIIPSWNAFGNTGSADGRVLPYTPVIYEVEVLEVAQK